MSLASWRDTPSRAAIVEFTEAAAQEVPPEEPQQPGQHRRPRS
jgi:hypothetical protein